MASEEIKPLEVVIPIDGSKVVDILRSKLHFFYEPPVDIKEIELIHELNLEIRKLPMLDVVEVKHGKWETTNVTQDGDNVELFHHHHKGCKFGYGDNSPYGYDYCPNCGAKMDKEGNTE